MKGVWIRLERTAKRGLETTKGESRKKAAVLELQDPNWRIQNIAAGLRAASKERVDVETEVAVALRRAE